MSFTLIDYPVKNIPRLTHFGYSDLEQQGDVRPHRHPGYEMVYFAEGTADLAVIESEPSRKIRQGDLLLVCPETEHSFLLKHQNIAFYWLGFQAGHRITKSESHILPPRRLMGDGKPLTVDYLEEIDSNVDEIVKALPDSGWKIINGFFEGARYFREIRDELESPRKYTEQLIYLKLLELMTSMARKLETPAGTGKNEVIDWVVRYLEANYQKPVPLSELAEKTGLSIPHLSRLFKKTKGVPPGEYLTALRIENAVKLLDRGKSVTSAATESGFSSIYSFSSQFKKRMGASPSEFRNKIK